MSKALTTEFILMAIGTADQIMEGPATDAEVNAFQAKAEKLGL